MLHWNNGSPMFGKRPWFNRDRERALLEMLAAGLVPTADSEGARLMRHLNPRRIDAAEVTIFSTCSGAPMTDWIHGLCEAPYEFMLKAEDRDAMAENLRVVERDLKALILKAIEAPEGTEMLIAASPADAFRMAAMLYALECEGAPMRWLVPAIGENADDVIAGMKGRVVRPGADRGDALLADNIEVVEIPLRRPNGDLLEDAAIAEAFAKHQAERTIRVMSFGDETGAAGPVLFRSDLLDATQMRVRPARLGEYLTKGFPIVVSAATFVGGPGPSGALLIPPDYFPTPLREGRKLLRDDLDVAWKIGEGFTLATGNLLRWSPAVEVMRQQAECASKADIRVAQFGMQMQELLADFDEFEAVPSRAISHVAFCGRDSGIVPFAVRRGRYGWMSMAELAALYEKFAAQGVLLGLPSQIGERAALRLSIGAADVLYGNIDHKFARLANVLTNMGFRRKPKARGLKPGTVHPALTMDRPEGVSLQ